MQSNVFPWFFLSQVAPVLVSFILVSLAIWMVNQFRKYHPLKVLILGIYALQRQRKPQGTSQ
ncbi:hypothetical protein [Chroogloeocystis siderophila]|jgi:mannose/fructose/N-acetylgalactosamine-specific phosphotransferase system component IID|uniref:Uncharacterized protein n=1 Tax=Chroogloeocystis siderophila 5.2 s.c.1 TaxID=247279 RepID=A0A1U7HDB1_9CHRO|nr:hypothetical protein [Chroogloeocystis siderophila]OKH21531.1 hypothetical protein NIES1031_21760 [Chroogloeocystis siderophila 5.2 s.c.1]